MTLHDLPSQVGKKPYIEDLGELKPGDEDEERVAAEAWGNYLKRDRSVIVDLFQGQLKSTVTCSECGCKSAKFETFMYLSLPVPSDSSSDSSSSSTITIDACLREFMKAEELDADNLWRCPQCKDFRSATKQFELWKLPPIVLVHFKRFRAGARGRHSKREDAIHTPLEGLDLSQYVSSAHASASEASTSTYQLYAVCNHHGTMGGGHYTADCRSAGFAGPDDDRSRWHTLDDSSCRAIPPSKVVNGSNYLLFFERSDEGHGEARPRRQTGASRAKSSCSSRQSSARLSAPQTGRRASRKRS